MSRNLFWMAMFVFLFLMGLGVRKDVLADQKIVIGWLEEVYLPECDFIIKAKIDTGAKNSSIHAVDLEYIAPKGKAQSSRIRFRTMDLKGKSRIIEADLVREAHIKKSSAITRTRPEIELEVCLGGVRKRIRVNLADRGGMNYRMILGRTALEGDFIVDISKKYVGGPRCPKP
jgi:hypothetical protein